MLFVWGDGVIPLPMEIMSHDINFRDLFVGDFDSRGVLLLVQLRLDIEALPGGGAADEIEDGLVADERTASPVLGNEGEHAVFDPVPLGGAGGNGIRGFEAPLCLPTVAPRPSKDGSGPRCSLTRLP
jgi:hypothetical protein